MRKIRRSAEWGTPLDGICIRPIGVATLSTCWHEVPLAPSLRELLSAARLRECTALSGMRFQFCTAIVGVANLATRWHEVPLLPLPGEPRRLRRKNFIASLKKADPGVTPGSAFCRWLTSWPSSQPWPLPWLPAPSSARPSSARQRFRWWTSPTLPAQCAPGQRRSQSPACRP